MSVADVFADPPPSCRPTPLFWWTGADLDRERLAAQLDELVARGIGGTVVGYSHLPDGDLDHGDPAPLSPAWWELFRWFTEASAARGMTVGLQDYGLNGPLLRQAGRHTADLGSGTLTHLYQRRTGPGEFRADPDGGVLVAAVAADEQGTARPIEVGQREGAFCYSVPPGVWEVSLVLRRPTFIGHHPSSFDPLHPEAGARLIEVFYARIATELGPLFGTTFTTIFQDELDFGLRMPMWNDLVGRRLGELGFDHREWLPALWLDRGEQTLAFRAAYRDVVVSLLEDHYFRPIFRWHRRHHTSMLVDQVSRGDLRLGRRAYGDYLQTMRWYDGPGNDDPDLTTPRSVAAFKVSASLARLNDRPYVANEAFHSSGWGIAPQAVLAGLNAGFGYGVNQVLMHGLSYTSEGGWWEWASPDFHFRQPWWQHSTPLWHYVTRTCALLRWGTGVAEVAVLDPTQDLDLTCDAARSPEVAVSVLAGLAGAGHDADLLDRQHLLAASVVDGRLRVGRSSYRGLVLPDLRAMRADALAAVLRFADHGGLVVVLGEPPEWTEEGPVPSRRWASTVRGEAADLPQLFARRWEPDFDARGSGLVAAHRRGGSTDLYFLTNPTEAPVRTEVDVRAVGRVRTFDAWTAAVVPLAARPSPGKRDSTRLLVELAPGMATVVVVDAEEPALVAGVGSSEVPRTVTTRLTGPWQVEVVPVLDNRFGDFEHGAEPLGVETWHVRTGGSETGPWRDGLVRDGATFLVLGPVRPEQVAAVEDALPTLVPRAGAAGPGEAGELRWREYGFSYETGLAEDPLLLDRMTGPHGLKQVPDELLDPLVLDADPPAGDRYYFWSTVDLGSEAVVTAGARVPYRVWVDGRLVLEQPEEVPAHRTPAWNLRDLTVVNQTRPLAAGPGRTPVLLELTVSSTQPTRASLALGTAAVVEQSLARRPPRARSRWFRPGRACLPFDPRPAPEATTVWVRAASPPGLQGVRLTVRGQVRSARLRSSGQQLSVHRAEPRPGMTGVKEVWLTCSPTHVEADELLLELLATEPGHAGAAVLTQPLRWELAVGSAATADFLSLGLADYSGLVRFRRAFRWRESGTQAGTRAGTSVWLGLTDLAETARVTINGQPAGVVFGEHQQLEVSGLLREGDNEIEVEVANTLLNRFSVLPSPFARMQQPGGGFSCVRLTTLVSAT